jgi:hypothetical protein
MFTRRLRQRLSSCERLHLVGGRGAGLPDEVHHQLARGAQCGGGEREGRRRLPHISGGRHPGKAVSVRSGALERPSDGPCGGYHLTILRTAQQPHGIAKPTRNGRRHVVLSQKASPGGGGWHTMHRGAACVPSPLHQRRPAQQRQAPGARRALEKPDPPSGPIGRLRHPVSTASSPPPRPCGGCGTVTPSQPRFSSRAPERAQGRQPTLNRAVSPLRRTGNLLERFPQQHRRKRPCGRC